MNNEIEAAKYKKFQKSFYFEDYAESEDIINHKNTKIIVSRSRTTFIFFIFLSLILIFCTKVTSKLARTASSAHGYKDLVKELCGKDISKKEQQSDWGNPNLSTKQINYAAQDTEYLFEIKNKLTTMLKREKRIDLFEKCMKVIPVLVDMEMSGYKLETFEH